MTMIDLVIVEPDEAPARDMVLSQLLAQWGIDSFQNDQLKRDGYGKPYLDLPEPRKIGYSSSHARWADGSFGLFALAENCAIGIDVEPWPKKAADAAFLETIAVPEDAASLAHLGGDGYDASTALWVIKETALKCTGEVMIDPRHLAVRRERKGTFLVSSSKMAGAPHPDIRVTLYLLQNIDLRIGLFLVGIGLSANCDAGKGNMIVIQKLSQSWKWNSFEPIWPVIH